jgi:hypothetical protein
MEPKSKAQVSINICQSRPQTNISQKKQRRSLHFDKGNNLSRVYNNCKHIHIKHWHTQFYKINSSVHKITDKPQNTIIVVDTNTPFSTIVRSLTHTHTHKHIHTHTIKKKTSKLNNIIDHIDLIYIYSRLHPIDTENTFFS